MKKIICTFLALMCVGFYGYANLSFQDVQTKLSHPFNALKVPVAWKVVSSTKSEVAFEYHNHKDISFDLVVGKSLKGSPTLDTLELQLHQYAHEKAHTIPLLVQSFGPSNESRVAAGLSQQIYRDFTHVTIQGIEWLRVTNDNQLEIVTNGKELFTPLFECTYFSLFDDRIHAAKFSAPADLYPSHEPFFEATMANLHQ